MANDEKGEDEKGNEIDDKFASNLFGAFLRTMVWFVGEVEDNDMWISKRDKDGNTIHLKLEDSMAKFILLVFIFLFVY